jgi:hypothetical protein
VGEPLGVPCGLEAELVFPVAEQQKAQNNEQAVASDPKLIVSALFASSGAVAPVDFARFGQCVGEIIARARGPRREPSGTCGR